MFLEIITPDKKVFSGEVASVKMPGSMGEFEVLKDHAALVSSLGKGKVTIRATTGKEFVVEGGVVEVRNNKVVLLAETLLS